MLATALPNTRGDSRIYRHFLSSAVQCVRDSAPKFGQFCQMYRPPISTDTLIEEVLRVDRDDVCNCASMHHWFGLAGTDLAQHTSFIVPILDGIEAEYQTLLKSTPTIGRVQEVQHAISLLPANWFSGMLDKGTTKLYAS